MKGERASRFGQSDITLIMERGDHRARFVAALALSVPKRWTLVCKGKCPGRIAPLRCWACYRCWIRRV